MASRKNCRTADLARDALALALGLVIGGAAVAAVPPFVHQRDKTFDPEQVEIARGDTLRFTNEDPFIHHLYIESAGFNFDSGDQRPGRVVAINFDQTGEFVLRCAIHLKMQLVVTVR